METPQKIIRYCRKCNDWYPLEKSSLDNDLKILCGCKKTINSLFITLSKLEKWRLIGTGIKQYKEIRKEAWWKRQSKISSQEISRRIHGDSAQLSKAIQDFEQSRSFFNTVKFKDWQKKHKELYGYTGWLVEYLESEGEAEEILLKFYRLFSEDKERIKNYKDEFTKRITDEASKGIREFKQHLNFKTLFDENKLRSWKETYQKLYRETEGLAEDPELNQAAQKILEEFRRLFSEGEKERKKYNVEFVRRAIAPYQIKLSEGVQEFQQHLSYKKYFNQSKFKALQEKYQPLYQQTKGLVEYVESDGPIEKNLLEFHRFFSGAEDIIKDYNSKFVRQELKENAPLFNKVERYPLTHRQKEAAIIDEDNDLVIAGAGTGKTSVIMTFPRCLYQSLVECKALPGG